MATHASLYGVAGGGGDDSSVQDKAAELKESPSKESFHPSMSLSDLAISENEFPMTSPSMVGRVPQHLAVIMDGNGRWANQHGLPRVAGHKKGASTVRMVVEESRRLGIRYLTLFSFSSENWKRPVREVGAIMSLFRRHLRGELSLLKRNRIRLRVIGDRTRLPTSVLREVEIAEQETLHFDDMHLILAVSYSGRDEIVQAIKHLATQVQTGALNPKDISAEHVQKSLFLPDVPDPDMLLRTSNEFRISNFLLWQLAYTEIVISPTSWPSLTKGEFMESIKEFAKRERRFGLTGSQVKAGEL